MAFVYLIFAVAAAISGVAAYFSLIGLGSIFAATFWGVVVMGAALEAGKIVTAKWVHANWRNPSAPWYFRGLLCFFVACLMTITSLGIYGYLSKGHLEQQAPLAGLGIQVAQLETQLKQKQDENKRLEERLAQISTITNKVLEGSARAGLRASNQSKAESANIQKSIDANNQAINDITQKLVPLKMKTGDVEGELGVAKYFAELVGINPEKAIQLFIALIMSTFDTLAISMFIMGSISLAKVREEKKTKATDVDWSKYESSMPLEPVVVPEGEDKEELVERVKEAFEKVDLPTKPVEQEPAPISIEPGEGNPIEFQEEVPEPLDLDKVEDEFREEIRELLDKEHEREIEDDLVHMRNEQEKRLAELDEAHEAIQREREEFNEEMEQVKGLLTQVADLDEAQEIVRRDQIALKGAHQQLLDMEARLTDERELLGQWEEQLKQQQEAINAWRPERHDMEDGRDPKDMIIEVLEMNPDIVNDIVQVAIAMQNARPGL